MGTVQGYGLSVGLESSANLVINPGVFFKITTVTTIVAGTIFLMWLGEQITQRGIGNGISLIIFSGIVAEIPRALVTTFELGRTGAISTLMIVGIFVLLILTIMFIVYMERALRKILINYPKRQMGNKMYGGESSHLPLKINQAGVIPAIFASALLLLPVTFSNFNLSDSETFLNIKIVQIFIFCGWKLIQETSIKYFSPKYMENDCNKTLEQIQRSSKIDRKIYVKKFRKSGNFGTKFGNKSRKF